MNSELDRQWQLTLARVSARTVELIAQHDEWGVSVCLSQAMVEEVFLNGIPTSTNEPPVGLVGQLPIERVLS